MKPLRRTLTLAAVLSLLALPGLAQDRMAIAQTEGLAFPILRCLRAADLTDAQRADIKAIVEAARPQLEEARQKVYADRVKLHDDLEAGADTSVLGQDVLDLNNDMKAVQALLDSVRDQVISRLATEQKTRVEECLAVSKQQPPRRGRLH